MSRLTAALLALAVSGCVHARLQPIAPADTGLKQHSIFVDHDGRPLAPRVDSGGVQLGPQEYGAYLHEMLDAVRASGKHQILVWVHGGLVPLSTGFELTRRIVHDIVADSTQRDVYPIAINWESALESSYLEHLTSIRQGERETRPVVVLLTTPLYLLADVGRAATRAPVVWYGQASRFVESDYPDRVQQGAQQLTAAMDSVLVPGTGAHPGAIALSIGEYHATTLEDVARFASLVFIPFKMLGTFAIDWVGTPGWQVMHRRTQLMYRATGEWRAVDSSAHYLPPTGAVAVLLDSLVGLANADSTRHYRVTVIGHSMGTIVASEAIRTHPRLPISSIVFMGAAALIREFAIDVLPYLEAHHETRFYNVMLHPISERRESYLADLAPDGSLLEWVDGYLSSPETGLDRVVGKWNNVIVASSIIPDSVRGQVHFKAFGYRDGHGYGKHRDKPNRHGDFDEPGVPFWRCDFWQPTPTRALCQS